MENEWIEIFNLPKGKRLSDENPDKMLRIPKHTFMKIEVV